MGSFRVDGGPPSVSEAALRRMGDQLKHRGPDAQGVFLDNHAAFVHRRLIVRDPTDAGSQPMLADDGSGVLLYNGELYNDAELRDELEALGVRFRSSCDTETVLHAMRHWGPEAPARFRGMFALAWYEPGPQRLTLARDPLGIKPLFYAEVEDAGDVAEVVFASEPPALFEHPKIERRPDPVAISSYLTTIRVTIGERTLFEGVRTLRPGEVRTYERGRPLAKQFVPAVRVAQRADTREVVAASVEAHLTSDVPLCSLLSGGLDSSVVALVAQRSVGGLQTAGGLQKVGGLRTFCAGDAAGGADFDHAEIVAAHLGTQHTAVRITEELFRERWRWLIDQSAMPLCTPNEVAIYEVARALRSDSQVAALSGEGADELFAGYVAPLAAAMDHVRAGVVDGGAYQYDAHAWLPRSAKPSVLRPEFWSEAEEDARAIGHYRSEWEASLEEPGVDHPLESHLRMHRRINLTGLLRRLDAATMRASVEGRTPLADVRVAELAAGIPVMSKCSFDDDGSVTGTKLPLRGAFAEDLPRAVVDRPKQSFPLPFQSWVGSTGPVIRDSAFLRTVFTDGAVESVAADPSAVWTLSWPMANLAMWAEVNGFG